MSELSPDESSIAAPGVDPGRCKVAAHQAGGAETFAVISAPAATPNADVEAAPFLDHGTLRGESAVPQNGHEKGASITPAVTVITPFDYSAFDRQTAAALRSIAEKIRTIRSAAIFAIGAELIKAKAELKAKLGHGKFGQWLDAEFGMTERTAQRYMQAADTLGRKSDTVSVLPPAAIYKLTARSTPLAVRNEIVQRIEAGERPSAVDITARIDEAREQARMERMPLKQRAVAKQKFARAQRRADDHRRTVAEHVEEQQREQAEELAALDRLVTRLNDRFSDDELREIAADLSAIWWGGDLATHLRGRDGRSIDDDRKDHSYAGGRE